MRRAVARGRVFPQNYSIDRRYGRLSLKATALFPLMWVNADDQGRLIGDPEEIKYSCCPNIDHITKADVPGILHDLVDNKLIIWYETPKTHAIQIIDWWDPHRKPQWAWPSDYPPPEGWQDHLRYKGDAKTVITLNWSLPGEEKNGSQVSNNNVSGEDSGEDTNDSQVSSQVNAEIRSGDDKGKSRLFPRTPIASLNNGFGGGRGRGRGNSPEGTNGSQVSTKNRSGENPRPRQVVLTDEGKRIYEMLKENYRTRWGHVNAKDRNKVTPRPLGAKDNAQLRDLAIELSNTGTYPEALSDYIKQAFDESGATRKFSVSYVRAILFDWLGVKRERIH